MITIEIPAWAFWMLLSLFCLNLFLSHLLWRADRALREVTEEHNSIQDRLVNELLRRLLVEDERQVQS